MKEKIIEILKRHAEYFFPNGYVGGQFIEADKFEMIADELIQLNASVTAYAAKQASAKSLAEGGIVTGPMRLHSEELGGEMILPLDKLKKIIKEDETTD